MRGLHSKGNQWKYCVYARCTVLVHIKMGWPSTPNFMLRKGYAKFTTQIFTISI